MLATNNIFNPNQGSLAKGLFTRDLGTSVCGKIWSEACMLASDLERSEQAFQMYLMGNPATKINHNDNQGGVQSV